MENIKQRLKRDYNEAIEKYNNGDCVGFFRNIRPAIEAFCKLVVCDLVGQQLAEELLNGQKTFDVDFKKCTVKFKTPTKIAVQNSMLAKLAQQTIYYKKGQTLALYDTQKKVERLKKLLIVILQALQHILVVAVKQEAMMVNQTLI